MARDVYMRCSGMLGPKMTTLILNEVRLHWVNTGISGVRVNGSKASILVGHTCQIDRPRMHIFSTANSCDIGVKFISLQNVFRVQFVSQSEQHVRCNK